MSRRRWAHLAPELVLALSLIKPANCRDTLGDVGVVIVAVESLVAKAKGGCLYRGSGVGV